MYPPLSINNSVDQLMANLISYIHPVTFLPLADLFGSGVIARCHIITSINMSEHISTKQIIFIT